MQLCQEIQIHSGKNVWLLMNMTKWICLKNSSENVMYSVYWKSWLRCVCGRIVIVYFGNAYKFQQESGRNQETFEKLKKINLKC